MTIQSTRTRACRRGRWPASQAGLGPPAASVQGRRLRLRLVVPGPAPQLLALLGQEAAAHPDDRVQFLESRSVLDPLAQSHPDLLQHCLGCTQAEAGLTKRVVAFFHTTNWPSRCSSSPSTVIEPPLRRSQTM